MKIMKKIKENKRKFVYVNNLIYEMAVFLPEKFRPNLSQLNKEGARTIFGFRP